MQDVYKKYQAYLPAAFFVVGFLFDLLTTDRIDRAFSLWQQAFYLFLLLLLVYWEVVTPKRFLETQGVLPKLWNWHVEALHFLFGSLLSLYTIFYFKSASMMTSFLFMFFLTGLLVINELPQLQKRGVMVRSALLALCLASYLTYLVPVATGAIGPYAFVLAMIIAMAVFLLLCSRVHKTREDTHWVKKNMLLPGMAVQIAFVALYFFKILPPVPISLKHIGIYHSVAKENGLYVLNYERSWWRFWQSGAQTFLKREGDSIYCFVSVFSPTEFQEQLRLVWYKASDTGWVQRDSVPLDIRGGRDHGFRGYAVKANYEPGDWQVRVKTSDDREVGRISFEVIESSEGGPRQWRQDQF